MRKTYRFDEFELHGDTGALSKNGQEISLQPQVHALLSYLLEHPDRIISKDELVDALWDGRIVSDAVLNTRVRDVRRALGDDGRSQRYIKTFPKRGIRFVADVQNAVSLPVTDTGAAAPPQPGRSAARRQRISVPVLAVLAVMMLSVAVWQFWSTDETTGTDTAFVPERPSVAVLRFATRPDAKRAWLGDGLAEELIADLSRFRELFVISRNTSFTFDTEATDPRDLATELGVRYVARGSIRETGDQLFVTAELIDTTNGALIWTEKFESPVADVFAVQDDISSAIAGRILPELERAGVKAGRHRESSDLSAWDLLLQARGHQTVFTKDGQERAISLALAALERDPDLSAAWSLIAQARGNLFFWSGGDIATRDAAIAAARAALEADPDDPIAHAALGYVWRFTGDEARSVGSLSRAVELNPNSALIRLQLGHTLDWFRRQDEALPQIEQALSLSPRDPLLQNMLFYKAHVLFHLGRYDASLAASDEMGAVVSSGPWEIFYHLMRAAALAELGHDDAAQNAIDAALDLNPGLSLTTMKARFDKSRNHPENRSAWLASLRKAGLPD